MEFSFRLDLFLGVSLSEVVGAVVVVVVIVVVVVMGSLSSLGGDDSRGSFFSALFTERLFCLLFLLLLFSIPRWRKGELSQKKQQR